MGSRPYTKLDQVQLDYTCKNIVVEIGSENGEGSSLWLHTWAEQRGMSFYSVDVEHRMREAVHRQINWVVFSSGSQWCRTVLPRLDKTIKVLYLDNFDWIWDTENLADHNLSQIRHYAARGVDMNNAACQEEHRQQVEYCLPYFDQQAVVIMDDTFYSNNQWDGKCATAIPLLLENGFEIVGNELALRGCKANETN